MMGKVRTLDLTFDVKSKDELIWNNQIVMSSTERDYFERLFSKLATLDIVADFTLEIGYGLGISAGLIQQHLTPISHEIVEIDKGIYRDLIDFAAQNSSVRPLLGDWRSLDFSNQKYDFIFHDSYDFSGAPGWEYDSSKDDYEAFKEMLKPTGHICHPHFGDGPVREVNGFTTLIVERLVVAPILMWDKTICADVAIVLRKPIT
jgi:spermidine synthase